MVMIERREMPSRIGALSGGVESSPSRTTKRFSPVPSQTLPKESRRMASS